MRKISIYLSLLCTLSIFISQRAVAQDPQYSQFYSNLVLLNPAFTGSGIGPRLAFNHRAQWVRIPGHYKQFAFAYDQPVIFLGSSQGLGIAFNSDVAGEGRLRKLNTTLNYAYQIELDDKNTLRLGLSAGFTQASIDFSRLRFPDQIDERLGFVLPTQEPGLAGGLAESSIRPDVNAGIAYFNEFVWLGFSIHHITEPEELFYTRIDLNSNIDSRLPRKYTLTGGLRIPVSKRSRSARDVSITPAFLVKWQGEFSQVDAGLYVNVEPMVFGVWYRHQDAFISLIGVKTGPLSFGYSFDYTTSGLTQNESGGSHEFSVVMEFEQYRKSRKRKHRKMPCPRF